MKRKIAVDAYEKEMHPIMLLFFHPELTKKPKVQMLHFFFKKKVVDSRSAALLFLFLSPLLKI